MASKILLVGLGGTGCSVVQQVKTMVGPNTQNIQFLGIDTDQNNAEKYGLDLIGTGRNILLSDLLDNEPDAKEWFPYEPTLLDHNLLKGAGQVRALSRLALKDTIRQGRLGKLIDAINTLHTAGQDDANVSYYVVLVSSFAGGTGSGMFISLALYLRRYLLEHFGTNCLIDGVFALPDVFVDGKISDVQKESMFANTFAALKELVNVNRVCLSRSASANEINMVYQAAGKTIFNSTADRVDEKDPPVRLKPFDMMFFFDKVNSEGKVLPGNSKEYMRCMAQAVYMRYFAPSVRETVFSDENNQVIAQIEANNENRYGALGTAKLIYPYEDILRYCNLRSARDTIGGCWTAPEIDYAKRRKEELERKKLNPKAKVRSRGDVYIAWLEDQVNKSQFAFLKSAILQESGENPANGTSDPKLVKKQTAYFNTVKRYINAEAEKEMKLPTKATIGTLERLIHSKIVKTVENTENGIKKTFNQIKESFLSSAIYRTNAIFPEKIEQLLPASDTVSAENIANLLRKDGHAVHPLATRYLLYKVRELFSNAKSAAEKSAADAERKIDEYIHKDWLPKTKGVTDSAQEAIPNALNVLGLTDFSRRYVSKSREAIDLLSDYRLNQLTSLVYEGVLKRLDLLISQYEQLFDLLPVILKEMDKEIIQLANMHSSVSMEQYVCCSPSAKERLYETLEQPEENGDTSPIYDSLLHCLCNHTTTMLDPKKSHNVSKADEKLEKTRRANDIKKLFKDQILPHYFEMLNEQEGNGDKLDKDILDALDEEARDRAYAALRENTDRDEPTAEECSKQRMGLISDLVFRAAPHLKYKDGKRTLSRPKFWTVNRAAAQGKVLNEILKDGSGDAPSVMQNDAFPRHELTVYRSVLGLLLSDVQKFVDYGKQHGEYYEFYEKRLRKISEGSYKKDDKERDLSITPYVDARWHKREYLQPLSEERDTEDKQKAARAMWLGVIYRNIRLAKNQRSNQLCISYTPPDNKAVGSAEALTPLYYRDEPVNNFNQMYQLYHALLEDNLNTGHLLDVLDPVYREDAHSFMAIGSSGYNMRGKNANRLLRALHDEENAAKPQAGLNVLTLVEDILKLQAMDQRSIAMLANEKALIIAELMKIINGLQMTDARKKELCVYIAQCSIYKTNVAARARDAQFLPDFHLMDLPIVKTSSARKKKEEPAETAEEKSPATKSTVKKATATKATTTKATATKATATKATATKATAKKATTTKATATKATTAKATAKKATTTKTTATNPASKKETAPEGAPAKAEGKKKTTVRKTSKKTQA